MWQQSNRRANRVLRPGRIVLTILFAAWWLLASWAVVWIMPESTASAAPTPNRIVSAGVAVRIAQPGRPPFPIARDRSAFDAMQSGAFALDESTITLGVVTFEWIKVEHGQKAYVIALDGDAAQIEMLEGEYAGDRAWIHRGDLAPQ
jgi:hypothetical protein